MPIQITFVGESHEHVVAEINAYLAVHATPVATQEAEAPTPEKEKPTTSRRGRGRPKKEETEEKPKTSRRGRPAAKKEDKISPLLSDALKVAHQMAEEFEEGEETVKEIMEEEFQKSNLSDLTDEELKKVTEIILTELNAPDPAED